MDSAADRSGEVCEGEKGEVVEIRIFPHLPIRQYLHVIIVLKISVILP